MQVVVSSVEAGVRASSLALGGIVLALALLSCGRTEPPPAQEGAGASGATRVRVDRPLDIGTLALLQRGQRQARALGHDCLLIEIDTPGGEVELMNRFAGLIQQASRDGLLTVGWVSGQATSAGALVALACDKIYMASGSTMGSATPVGFGPQGIAPIPEEGGVREKVLSLVRAKFRAVAEAKGRPGVLAEAMVDAEVEVREVRVGGERRFLGGTEWDDLLQKREPVELVSTIVRRGELLNLIGSEAYKLGLTDGIAESLEEVMARIGKRDAQAVSLERSRSEEILALLERFSPLLLVAALALGWMELKTPGFGLAGILSLGCFFVLLVGRYLAGLADVPHIVLVVVGLALVATELFLVPGTIWVGVSGGVLVLLGLLAAELGPGFELSSGLDRKLALDSAFHLVLSAGGALVLVWILSRFLPQMPVLGRMVQVPATEGAGFAEALPEAQDRHAAIARVGAAGRTLTALRPVGKVALDADPALEFEARAEGELIEAGERVRVRELWSGRLVVERDAEVRA